MDLAGLELHRNWGTALFNSFSGSPCLFKEIDPARRRIPYFTAQYLGGPMEAGKGSETTVLNLMDGREGSFPLPPEKAVVAAYELFELGLSLLSEAIEPPLHPLFKEYRLGYACGDWIAYKDAHISGIN